MKPRKNTFPFTGYIVIALIILGALLLATNALADQGVNHEFYTETAQPEIIYGAQHREEHAQHCAPAPELKQIWCIRYGPLAYNGDEVVGRYAVVIERSIL